MTVWVVRGLGLGVEGGENEGDSAEIHFQSFLQETTVSNFGVGRYVHSLTLSIQPFLCRQLKREISSPCVWIDLQCMSGRP